MYHICMQTLHIYCYYFRINFDLILNSRQKKKCGHGEWNWNYVIRLALISLIPLVWHLRRKNSYKRSKLPPGPMGWPGFGNLFDLGSLPLRSLEALKKEYSPVVWLSVGPIKTMVILSTGAAKELFKNHDRSSFS